MFFNPVICANFIVLLRRCIFFLILPLCTEAYNILLYNNSNKTLFTRMKINIKQCQDLNKIEKRTIVDTLINDSNTYKTNKYNIINENLFNARINKTRLFPYFFPTPYYDNNFFPKAYYDFALYMSNETANKLIGYFTLNDIFAIEIYKNNTKEYIKHPQHYFYSLELILLNQDSKDIIHILKYIIQFFQNIVKKNVKPNVKVVLFLDIDYNNKLLTPKIITETTNFKYYGTDKNNYDLQFHIFKLNLNDVPESTKMYSKSYLISRQNKYESALNDTQLIANLHNMKLKKNEDTYRYFDFNMVVFLHTFEYRKYFILPNTKIMPIYIMNIMNNGISVSSYYHLYTKMKIFNKKYANGLLEPCYKLSSNNLFKKHIDIENAYIYIKSIFIASELSNKEQIINYEDNIKKNPSLECYYFNINSLYSKILKYKGYNCYTMFFYVVSIVNNKYKTFVYDIANFLVYIANDKNIYKYFDETIKDTYTLDLQIHFFPDDLNNIIDTNKFFSKVKNILKDVSIVIEDEIFPLRNVANSFEIYCYFFAIDKHTHDPILFDTDTPSFCNYFSSKQTIFTERYFNWLNDIIYKP